MPRRRPRPHRSRHLRRRSGLGLRRGQPRRRGPRRGAAAGAGQVVYRFVPPVTGRYHLAVWSGAAGADPVATVRTHCGFSGVTHPELELGCNDDGAGVESRLRLALEAGVPVFIVVDGYRGSDAGWRGPFTLQVNRIAP
ncbi:MAG: hypothetical protein R3F60_13790 [bacterium]